MTFSTVPGKVTLGLSAIPIASLNFSAASLPYIALRPTGNTPKPVEPPTRSLGESFGVPFDLELLFTPTEVHEQVDGRTDSGDRTTLSTFLVPDYTSKSLTKTMLRLPNTARRNAPDPPAGPAARACGNRLDDHGIVDTVMVGHLPDSANAHRRGQH